MHIDNNASCCPIDIEVSHNGYVTVPKLLIISVTVDVGLISGVCVQYI